MKVLSSKIFDILNSVLSLIQSKTDNLRQNSYILSNIDLFIILSVILTLVASCFAQTGLIGLVSSFVPILIVIKVLITKGEKLEIEHCNFYLIIYLLICLISNFTSSMISQSFYGYMKTLTYFAFYFAMCQFLKNNKKYIYTLLCVIALLISIESFIGLIQNYIGVANISTWQDTSYVNPEDVLSRVYGTLKPYNPNLLGGYMVAGITSLLGLASIVLCSKKYKTAIIGILVFLTAAFVIFLTGCRGAYLALFVMIAAIIPATYDEKIKKIWKIVVVTGIILVVLFLLVNHGILQRLMSIFILRGDSSTSFRLNVYTAAVQMFRDNPIFGIGVGNKVFREVYGLYMLSGFDALSCYSVFLEMAVESGIFALFVYIMFLASLITSAVKKYITAENINNKILIFVSLVAVIGVMIHGVFDTVYFRPQIQFVFWTMTAILTSLVREKKAAE